MNPRKEDAHTRRFEKSTTHRTHVTRVLPCGRPLPNKLNSMGDRKLLEIMLNRLNSFIENRNIRYSKSREEVLETIIRECEAEHFTALDLIDLLKKRCPQLGPSAAYRALPILIESGILQKGPTDAHGRTFFELDHHYHDHMICLDCQRIFDFNDETIEKQKEVVSEKLDFTPRSHGYVIYASCNYFQAK